MKISPITFDNEKHDANSLVSTVSNNISPIEHIVSVSHIVNGKIQANCKGRRFYKLKVMNATKQKEQMNMRFSHVDLPFNNQKISNLFPKSPRQKRIG